MARTKDQSNAERDRRICLYRRNGFTYSEIAELESISRSRVSQIIHEASPEDEEEVTRAEIASLLEFAERKVVELINRPGYVMGPNGKVATDLDGEPVENRQLINESARTLVLIAEKRSRLFGVDKQQLKQYPVDVATQQANASIAALAAKVEADRRELEDYRRKFGTVVPGEVVRELPPAAEG